MMRKEYRGDKIGMGLHGYGSQVMYVSVVRVAHFKSLDGLYHALSHSFSLMLYRRSPRGHRVSFHV